MEKRDLDLIERFVKTDEMLGGLYRKHLEYEHRLEKYNSKPYLTPTEEIERKNLQKLKLLGRDKIEGILKGYRNSRQAGT